MNQNNNNMKLTNKGFYAKIAEFATNIRNGYGWIELDYITTSWFNMFNEDLDEEDQSRIAQEIEKYWDIQIRR